MMSFKTICLSLFLILPLASNAQTSPLDIVEYRVGMGLTDQENSDTLSLIAGMKKLVTNDVGISLAAGYSAAHAEENFFNNTTQLLRYGMFYRNNEIGTINVDYTYTRSKSPISKNTFKDIVYSATYYMEDVHLHFARADIDLGQFGDKNSSSVGFSYFPNDNLKLRLIESGMDTKGLTSLNVAYQPKMLDNSTLLSLGLSHSNMGDSITVSVTYYFDLKISLKIRSR